MPAQSTDTPAEDSGQAQDRHDSPVSPEEHDLLDEDGLLEDQPYASLEEEVVTYGSVSYEEDDEDDVAGPGSW
ncbi:MAG TPA: hypothetical protein VLS51_08900 [Propionibacteriaceae bacterium]|nr:hypothetical protein [Propionibacteriaceae bacterium]